MQCITCTTSYKIEYGRDAPMIQSWYLNMVEMHIFSNVNYYFSARATSGRALTVSFLLPSSISALLWFRLYSSSIIDFCPVFVWANEDGYMWSPDPPTPLLSSLFLLVPRSKWGWSSSPSSTLTHSFAGKLQSQVCSLEPHCGRKANTWSQETMCYTCATYCWWLLW